jgi:8-oxo-dGTP pyrophosphatase MutT (NUDIX family)
VIFRRGKWDLPKGKAEPGETMEQTALREVVEECGLEGIELQEFLQSTYHIYEAPGNFILKRTDWYLMLYSGSEQPIPLTKEEITEVRWIDSAQLDEICSNTFQSIREIIRGAF